MATSSKTDEHSSVIPVIDQHLRSIVYNPSLNSLIYLNDQRELVVRSADQLSTLFYRTQPLSNPDESYEILPCHDKILVLTSTHIYARQLYQGLYFLDSIVSSINDEQCHVLIELTHGDAQLLIQLLASLDLPALKHIAELHDLLKKHLDEHNSSSLWNLVQIPFDCLNAIKTCFDILRLHKQNIVQNPTNSAPMPGIVVVGLLLDYLTRYYHHKKSLNTTVDEHIGSTLESTNTPTVSNTPSTMSSFLNPGGRTTRERLMFSEATRHRTFTLWPHASFRWLSPENMAKAGFYYSALKDNDDRALCFACTVTLVCWEPSDSPWTEHGRHSPLCPFIKGDFTENVPLRTTCSIQPGKKIFAHQQQQKWLIKSNELLFNEQLLLFLNGDWMLRAANISNVIQIKTILSLKSLVDQLTKETISEEDHFAPNTDESISIIHFDRSTSRRYLNSTLKPLAVTMFTLLTGNEHENHLIFCFAHVVESNQCLLFTSTSLNSSETVVSSSKSIDHEDSPIETKDAESVQTSNRYDYLIEFSNLQSKPQQAFLYQLNKSKVFLLINTGSHLHGYAIEYDPVNLNLKILFYHCIFRSSNDDIDVQSICPIVFDDDDDPFNGDEQSMLSNDEEENLEFEHLEETEMTKKEPTDTRIQKRKCYLISLQSGEVILYDVYRTENSNSAETINGYLANRESVGSVDRCVHVRGTDMIYAWMKDQTVQKLNIRDLFPLYFAHALSDDSASNASASVQPKSSSSEQNVNSYTISTLRSLLTFTSFDSSPATYFFAQVNSSYWIDTLDTTKTNVDRHTWRLQQPQTAAPVSSIPSVHIFDLQTATPSTLHTIEFRFTLNRQHLYQKSLFITLYRHSTEQTDVDQKVEFNQLNSSSNFSSDDILAGPYSLIDYLESPGHDQGLIQLCSYDLLTYKSKRFRLVLESKSPTPTNGQTNLFPIEIISMTLRSTKHQARLLRLYDRSAIDSLTSTILNTSNEKKIFFALNLLISIIYTSNDAHRSNQIKGFLLNETFLQRTFLHASRTIGKRMATLILMVVRNEQDIEKFIENFLNLFRMNEESLLGFKSASTLKWFFVILGQWTKKYQTQIGPKLLQWLLQLAEIIRTTDTQQRQTLRNKFGYYTDPFDAHLFDADLSTLIECSLRHRQSTNPSSNSSTMSNVPQSVRPPGMSDNSYDPRIYSRYGTTGLPLVPTDPDSLYSPSNIQYALAKLLPCALSSSNVYLKPIPGLFEVTPLNYSMHSSSDGTHLERVDMAHLLALRAYESASAPPPPNVTLGAGPHPLYHPSTSSSIHPPPLPPAISTFNSSSTFPFSFPTPNINTYYDTLYMLPSTSSASASNTNDMNPTIVSSFSVPMSNHLGTSSPAENSMNNNFVAPSWLPHLASKFKDKQGLQKEKLKLIAKKNKAAAAQSSMLKKNSSLLNDLVHPNKSSLASSIPSTAAAVAASAVPSGGKPRLDEESNDAHVISSSNSIDDILGQVSTNLLQGQYLPLYQFIIDRLSGGGRSYFVLDFGQQVTLTDILIPSCTELASLSLDFWSHGEHIDCQRLFSSTHIASQPFFLHDLQPAIVARYIRITVIGQSNISISSIRLPVGYFFGHPFVVNEYTEQDTTGSTQTHEKYLSKLRAIEGIYETLISNYALCRRKLFNLLSSTGHVEKNFVEKIYRECLQLQIQINQANRQINQCRELLKLDKINVRQTQPTSDYLKLLTDLLTSELTSLSSMMQQTSSSPSFVSLEQALELFDTFAIRHVQIVDMPKRLLQFCAYQCWWPDFVKECFQRYFLSSSALTVDQQQALFIHLVDLCEQTLLTIPAANESTLAYNRLLAIEYVNNIYQLLLNSQTKMSSVEWLLLFLHRLSEKNLFPYLYEQINKKSNFSQLINKHWQFLHTSSVIQIPRLINPMNNYRRKIRKETVLKKSIKTTGTSTSAGGAAAASTSSSVSTQTNSPIIIAQHHAIDCFCHRSLALEVSRSLLQILIRNQDLSHECFMLICKSLSDISRSCKPLIHLNECLSKDDLWRLIGQTEQAWRRYALNNFFIDVIDNEVWLPNEIHDDEIDIEIDDEKDNEGNDDEWTRRRHFPAMKKKSKKISSQQIVVQMPNHPSDADLLASTTDDLLIYLTQSPLHSHHHHIQPQQQLQQPSFLALPVLSNNYEIIPFSIDNRLDGNIQFIFDLFTINQAFKIQSLLNKHLCLRNNHSIDYQLKTNDTSTHRSDTDAFFSSTTPDLLNEIYQSMLRKHLQESSPISYETLNQIEHLLSSYLIVSLANYSKNIYLKQMMNNASTTDSSNASQPPINLNLKPLFFMSIDTLDHLLEFYLRSSLMTTRLWHHLFSLLYYTSTQVSLANQMKEKWFQGEIENSLFARLWLKFIQSTEEMMDESTMDTVINYFERLFMSSNELEMNHPCELTKASKRTATSNESNPSEVVSIARSASKVNRLYLNTLLSLLNRVLTNGLHGPLNCHLKYLNYLFKLNFTDATPSIRLSLCRNIIDFVWSFCYSYSSLSFTLTDIHPLICFLNHDRVHSRPTIISSSNPLLPSSSSSSSVTKWPLMNTVNKLSIQNNQSASATNDSSAAATAAAAAATSTATTSKSTSIRRQSNLRDVCVRQMILLITKLMETSSSTVDHQRKRFKCEQEVSTIADVDDDEHDAELESIYVEKLLTILSTCHSALDSSPSTAVNASSKFLAASITSSDQHASFTHTTLRLNINDLLSVGDSIYYCLSTFINRPFYLLPILCHYLTSHPLLSSPLLLLIIYSLHHQTYLSQALNQYKLLDMLIENLISSSVHLSPSTHIASIQRIYDQRQSSNTNMDIGSINLSSQCQITCSNPNAQSPEILVQASNSNLQTTLPSSSRRLRSPPWSYTFAANEQRCTLTLQFPHSIILKSIQLITFTQTSVNHYTIIDHLNSNLSQCPSSITCEVSSDGYYFVPCGYLLNTQGQQIINLSITKQIDIVRQLRLHLYKPTDHDTIGLQQILIYGYCSYDQQMLIDQTCQPYQTLISTVYGKQISTSKSSTSSIVTTLNDEEIKLMYSSMKSSNNSSQAIDNSHQVSMLLADQYRSFNHYLQLIHFCLKNQTVINESLLERFLSILKTKCLASNDLIRNEIFILIGNSCSDEQFRSLVKYFLDDNQVTILSELTLTSTKIHCLFVYLTEPSDEEMWTDSMKQILKHLLWKSKEEDRDGNLDENLFRSLIQQQPWLLPSIAHHRPSLVMEHFDRIDSFVDFFHQLKSCSISVRFLDEILGNARFLRAVEELNQHIQSIPMEASFVHSALDYFISISKYANVQLWFSQTTIASSIWKKLLDLFIKSNALTFHPSASILLTQLISLLRNLSVQCPTNQENMTLISSYLAQLTEERLQQDRPLTGYLQYILSEVVLKQELIQCLINTRDYPINQQSNAHENRASQRNSLYQRLIEDCPITMNLGQLIEKLFGFNYLQANIWTAANYIKNKSYLIKASSEPVHSHHRRKLIRSELLSSRTNFPGKFPTKSISSLSTLTKHHKSSSSSSSSKSTSSDSSTVKRSSSSSAPVESVHLILHVQGQKRQCILPKTVRLSDLLLSFDCRALTTYQVDVMEMTFENHVALNEAQEKELIIHRSLVANRDYPTLLDTFVHANGLKILAQHFARNYPSIQSYDECFTSSSSSPPGSNVFDRINFFDLSSLVSSSSNTMTMPYYVFITFSIFLRLPNYARAMLKNRALACSIIRLMLGQKESIINEAQDQFQQQQDNFDMRQLSKLPFETLAILLKDSPDDLLDEILHSSILLLLLSCLSSITRHPHRKQKECQSHPLATPASSSLPPLPSSSTTHAESMLDDNDEEYYEDDIDHIESTIQQLNTINNSNSIHPNSAAANSNFWAKGTGFGTGSTHSQWKPDEILQIQKLHEEHVVYLFDIFHSIFSNKLCEELLDEHLIELINNSCLIPVLESYLRNDSILDLSKQGDIHRYCLRLVSCLLNNQKLKNLIYQTSNIESLIENLLHCVQTYTSMIQIDDDEQLNMFAVELQRVYDKIKDEQKKAKENRKKDSPDEETETKVCVSLDEFYCQTMKALQFSTYAITIENQTGEKVLFNKAMKYHYEDLVRDALTINSMQRIKRLAQEQITISTSLPLSYNSTIFVRSDENRMDIMRVLITGPDGTPYSNGCFLFDVYFPNEYPTSPPSINLETTGNHTVRFNPNLYNDGKVCLSILNTWHGRPEEKWNTTSTFLQVLVSIQSLIFVPEPYFNEPGYERTRGTAAGTAQSLEYDANIRQATVRWAMLEQLRNPPACFTDVIRRHFYLKRNEIIDQCEAWIRELQETTSTEKRVNASISQHLGALTRHTNDLKKELARLRLPEGFVIPSELAPFLSSPSLPAESTTTVAASISEINSTSEATTHSSSAGEHPIQIKIVPNLQYHSSSSSGKAESPVTLIDTDTQQSPGEHFDHQPNPSPSTNTNTYDVTITHSNSLLSDWTTTDTPTVAMPDDALIYDDLLDDEDDMDDDLDVEDMLDYEGDSPEGFPADYY